MNSSFAKLVFATLLIQGGAQAAVIVTSTPYYRSIEDSPFYSEIAAGRGYFENFETGEFMPYADIQNIHFETLTAGNAPDHGYSVDADDGHIDGIDHYRTGISGISLGAPNPDIPAIMTFTPNQLGQRPRWFGFVYTSGAVDQVQIQILGAGNSLLATINLDPVLHEISNRYVPGKPILDDTLISFVSDQEVYEFRISHFSFVSDHYQWGYNIPEPSGALLACLFVAAVLLRRPERQP